MKLLRAVVLSTDCSRCWLAVCVPFFLLHTPKKLWKFTSALMVDVMKIIGIFFIGESARATNEIMAAINGSIRWGLMLGN
jgi:hypothetical protein